MIALAALLLILAMVLCLSGRRGMLGGMVIVALLPWPLAFMATGFRSAVYGTDILTYFVALLWLWGLYGRDGRTLKLPLRNPLLIIGVYCAIGCLITVQFGILARRWTRFGWDVIRLFSLGLTFLIPASLILSRREVVTALRVFVIGVLIFSVLGSAESVGIISLPDVRVQMIGAMAQEREGGAISATLGFTRTGAGMAAMVGIVAAAAMLSLRAMSPLLAMGTCSMATFLLLASFSRTSLVATAAAGMALVLLGRRNRVRNALMLIAGGIVLVVTVANLPAFAQRFGTLVHRQEFFASLGRGAASRGGGWQLTASHFANSPYLWLTGVGYGGWAGHMVQVVRLSSAHQAYLQALAELGLIGVILLSIFWWKLMMTAWRNHRQTAGQMSVGAAMIALLVGMFVGSLGEVVTYPTANSMMYLRILMLFLGVCVGYIRGQQAEELALSPQEDYEMRRIADLGVEGNIA